MGGFCHGRVRDVRLDVQGEVGVRLEMLLSCGASTNLVCKDLGCRLLVISDRGSPQPWWRHKLNKVSFGGYLGSL